MMKISNLKSNNIKNLTYEISLSNSIGIGGLSGSGKSTFCKTIYNESIKRVVLLLPKSEYKFLFSDVLASNFSAQNITELPLTFYLGKTNSAFNPRSTVGTHTGIFKEIRARFASEHNKAPEFFSFNNSFLWCEGCKGRGSTAGKECKECDGDRYKDDVKKYCIKVSDTTYNISDINKLSTDKILGLSSDLELSNESVKILQNMKDLKIGYLSLNRVFSTLSGGETVRILLSEFLANTHGSLIIIDEISIGLDKYNLQVVLELLSERCKDNQIWLIDHLDTVLESTKENIFFGPGSGVDGGYIVKDSPRPKPVYTETNETNVDKYYEFTNLKKRNIDIESLVIPQNRIVSITGESGCGKSTLVHDCICPSFNKKYKKDADVLVIGQDRNQSITSKSTVASFLDIKKSLKGEANELDGICIDNVSKYIKNNKNDIFEKIELLKKLGLGYLELNRKIQTLSTGEFQCVHLASKLFEYKGQKILLIFDEPSKGLSQNILNSLMHTLREIVKNDELVTIIVIEHNDYILSCSDYVIDFGKRSDRVTKLQLKTKSLWEKDNKKTFENKKILINKSHIENKSGVTLINTEVDKIYLEFINKFRGGILKNLSGTARWIYGDYFTDDIEPVIAFDLEEKKYSENTFIFEIAGMINEIMNLSSTTNIDDFDFFAKDNLCECCKGHGIITAFDINTVIANRDCGIWDGLFYPEVMKQLKRYNFSKIKGLFTEIKKLTGCSLDKKYSQMNLEEKNIFLYGYWEASFYDKKKNTQRKWQGIIHLIKKYMRSSKAELKNLMKDSEKELRCPFCMGSLLNHKKKLMINGTDIRKIISGRITEQKDIYEKIPVAKRIVDICGRDVTYLTDVSKLPNIVQVRLKILEILCSNFSGYKIVLRNTAPFHEYISDDIKKIALNNSVIELNYLNIKETKKEILDNLKKYGYKASSYVYEVFGFQKIAQQIRSVKKKYPCEYCEGKGVHVEESIYDGVDITKTPCNFCNKTGISKEGYKVVINDITVEKWVNGCVGDVISELPVTIKDVKCLAKLENLNKEQILVLIQSKK